jgi:lysyl-tRNA synthetase class 2
MNIINLIRDFLNVKGFVEVETPTLQILPGGALAKPFKTYHNALDLNLSLRIAPELYLKMLVIGGFERVYEVGKSFRNEGVDSKHNPEFTMIEIYQAYADYMEMMDLCEDMICYVAEKLKIEKINYNGMEVEIKKPFRRISLEEIVLKELSLPLDDLLNPEKVINVAKEIGVKTEAPHRKIFDHIFETAIQPKLIQPTFIYDYPLIFSPLAKRKNEKVAQRFELFIVTEEIANAYSELNDPQEQAERFKQQEEMKKSGEEETHEFDKTFITALEYGMPPTAGLGIGIERLTMVFTGSPSIREVILFPLQRPV